MTLNFEAEVGEALYDCDASVSYDPTDGKPVVKLLEIRLVGEDGNGFTVVQESALVVELVAELKKRAVEERNWQDETRGERLAGAD